MNLIIEHGNTKRRIEGPFNICGTPEDLERIVECIQGYLTERPLCYGWIKITQPAIEQSSIINTPPIPWEVE